jgi:hypothetical protein
LSFPIHFWAPRDLRIEWIQTWCRNRLDLSNLVARLYYFLILCDDREGSPEDRWETFEFAAKVNGLVRAAYSAIRWRLNRRAFETGFRDRGSGVGLASLRYLSGSDEFAIETLRTERLGDSECFREEFRRGPVEVLTAAVRGHAAKKFSQFYTGRDEARELSFEALKMGLAREFSQTQFGDNRRSLFLATLGRPPGHAVARGASTYAHSCARLRDRGSKVKRIHDGDHEVDLDLLELSVSENQPGTEGDERNLLALWKDPVVGDRDEDPEQALLGQTERAERRENVRRILTDDEFRLVLSLEANPSVATVAERVGVHRTTVYRRLNRILEKVSGDQEF